MQSIKTWLNEIGLEKYASVFSEAEVETTDLMFLSEDDLRDLGLPLGPRSRVREAIKLLREATEAKSLDHSTVPNGSSEVSAHSAILPEPTDPERRQLTVMFVDLVGSTELATRIDPEDMRNVITSYQNTVTGVVGRFEGFVAKFMGDGVLCYFGWPRANEDDAERAVRAGLSIIENIKGSKATDGTSLAARIGLATGVVVVGDLIGSGATQEAAVVGETPNLAARLQGVAQPHQLVMPTETKRLLGSAFELRSLGDQNLKGTEKPQEVFVVEGQTSVESRFAARQTGELTPIIGRDRELELILERWQLAQSGRGQMVIVSGEAGIGKSRIAKATIDKISQDDCTCITNQCSAYHRDSAFFPVVQQLGLAAGFMVDDNIDARLGKLETLLGNDNELLKLITPIMGFDVADRYGKLDMTPEQQRAQSMRALTSLLIHESQKRPLLVIYEDLHWIDPTSLELLDILLDAIADQPIMILATARSSFEHSFGGNPIVIRFSLNRLGKEQIESIVCKLAGGKLLPDEIVNIIASRTDGVPLFVEELTKTILESGDLKEDGNRLVLDGQLDTITIPATLHDSLMARLDRLQPIKEVAQIAACIGREFGHGLLVKISGLSEADLGKALDGLIEAGLIYRRGLPPAASYSFKHALVRDTAYESLLKERRKGVHTKIFESLRSEVDVMPEILAFHAEAANLISTAADLRFEAGKAAIAKPAFDEAIAHLNKARSLLLRQPISPERNAKDLEICLTLGPALMATRGLAAREAEEIYQAARALSYSVCDDAQSFQAAWGLWLIFQQRGQIDLALNSTKEVMELAGRQEENIDYALQAYHAAWTTDLFVGNISKSFEQAVKGENLYDIKNHRGHAFSYGGHDPGVCAKTTKSEALCLLGHVEQAVLSADEAIEIAKRINHPFSLAMALYFMAQVHQYRREPELVQKHALLAIELCEEHGFESFRAQSAVLFGWATSSLGKSALGIMKIREGLAAWQSTGTGMRRPYFLGLLADSLLTAGKIEQGLEVIAEAENLIKQTRETRWLAETLRLKGVLMDNLGSSADEVLAVFNQALEIAEQQEARLLGLRVASSCGAFLHKNGKTTNARRMISQHCEWFDDKDNVPDLAEAKALLAEWANV